MADLTKLAERYGIRFTGVMIENYGDDTKDAPVRQTDESRFSYISADCCSSRTARSATTATTISRSCSRTPITATNTAYHQWPNRKAIVASLRELVAFQKFVLPADYGVGIRTPSNIMSKEGRQVIGRDIPEIRAIASTYLPSDSKLPYVQEFPVWPTTASSKRHVSSPAAWWGTTTCASRRNPN